MVIKKEKEILVPPLRITGLYALRRFRGSGYEKTQSGLRPLCVFSPPHFLCAGIASQFLYRAQKTSHTAKTLCASFRAGLFEK